MSSASAPGTCPYAVALHEDSDHSDDDLVVVTRKSCPAFENQKCPFKDAKTPEEVRQTLLKIPPSHFDPSGKFYKVIQEMHQVQSSVHSEHFHLPGGCPVQPLLQDFTKDPNVSFTQAMEDMSLAAIMARMASEMEDTDVEEDNDEIVSAEESKVAAAVAESSVKPEGVELSSPEPPVATKRLSQSLKTGTAVSHQAAEDVHFVSNFVRGKIDRNLYGELVVMLYHVYDALETALEQHAPQHFPTCHFPEQLERRQALLEDMDFWHGKLVSKQSPATRDYVHRIQNLARDDPLLLLAHSYTRYLGDLSGGRILARVARKALNLGQDGLAFYEFENIDSPKRFKDVYRQKLDELPLTSAQVNKLVGEANVAFVLNMRLFEELDVAANFPGASVRPLEDALAYANVTTYETQVHPEEKCPFMNPNKDVAPKASGKKCPWPFILLHDPREGFRDWKTWAVIGVFLCWLWGRMV